jgi:homocitrate synthase NifV
MKIARMLDEAGVGEIEAGTPAMGPEAVATIGRIVSAGLGARISVWCRASQADIEAAGRCGVEAVHLSLPVSRIGLRAIGRHRRWALRVLCQVIRSARGRFRFVSVGAQDASRADPTFLEAVCVAARKLEADRLRISDTVGVWNPFQVTDTIRRLGELAGPMELGFHGHNDLGMATANTLAALQAGASCADVTVNGLGERTGNAALEQVAMACRISGGFSVGLGEEKLAELCRTVSELSRRPVPAHQPISGSGAFRHESGVHVRAMLTDSRAYEPFAPEAVGREGRSYVVGAHSGGRGVAHALQSAGVQVSPEEVRQVLRSVRRLARRKRRGLTVEELVALAGGRK